MSKPVIRIKNVSKSYKISHEFISNSHPTIKDAFSNFIRVPLKLIGAAGSKNKETFSALDNVSINIYPGEVIALMGKNGSGKSTLLKILARITQPEKGEVTFTGKMSSMLEVGTGFHPELSGKENIYFNGSILGMSKNEIDEKYDSILEFAEIEKFIDTPVKFYSSGMRVRLAFSIAAHLEPDILLIDEVLAVGDVKFKQRSLERMKRIAESGTTIVFVSHVISQIREICTRGVLLDNGKVIYDGELEEGIEKYLELNKEENELIVENTPTPKEEAEEKDPYPDITEGIVSIETKPVVARFSDKENIIKLTFILMNNTDSSIDTIWPGIMIRDSLDNNVALIHNEFSSDHISLKPSEKKKIIIEADKFNVFPGEYSVLVSVHDKSRNPIYRKKYAARFIVPYYKNGDMKQEKYNPKIMPAMSLMYKYSVSIDK